MAGCHVMRTEQDAKVSVYHWLTPADLLQVREGLVPLIQEIKSKGTPPDSSVLEGNFDTKAQSALCNAIAVDLGFSLEQGRLDVSVHPFTGGMICSANVKCSTTVNCHPTVPGCFSARGSRYDCLME